MGYGALIGGLISGIGSAVGGLTSGGGGGTGGEAGTLIKGRQMFLDPFRGADYWNLNLPGLATESLQYGMQNAPNLNQFNMRQLQSLLGQVLPGYQGMVSQMGTNVSSLLAGNVPTDVQNQIQRFGAQQAISSGIGGGGAGIAAAPAGLMGKTITARDLGLTSLNLQQQGQAGLGNLLGMAKDYLMPQPVNPMSLLPFADLAAGEQWSKQAQFEANLAEYNAVAQQAAAQVGMPYQSPIGGIAQGAGGLLQSLGQTNPSTGQTGYDLIGSLFGGGGSGSGMLGAESYLTGASSYAPSTGDFISYLGGI